MIEAIDSFANGGSVTAYEHFGCHYIEEEKIWRFLLWAPNALSVSLVGDFNGWDECADPMERTGGAWCVKNGYAKQGQVYKYAVKHADGRVVYKADPFAFHCETGPATGSKVWDVKDYPWTDSEFRNAQRVQDRNNSPMSVYEVHIGSWRKGADEKYPNYRKVGDELAAYCTDMGYTHVELLPLTEYPYEGSWGYQVTGYFAPSSRYGTPEDFMYMVNTLHGAGISVIMDWVPAHFPRDEHGLAHFDGSSLYERDDEEMASHPDWGTLIFDYSKPHVQSFLLSSANMFLRRFHIDGLRVDAVSSMLYLSFGRGGNFKRNHEGGDTDIGAIAFLRRLNGMAEHLGCMCIAEESSAYPGVTDSEENGGLGFAFKWDMGYMHDTLDYMDIDPIYRRFHHDRLTFSMMYVYSEHFVLAFSHDEVVHGKRSMIDKMWGEYDNKFASLRTLYAYQYAHPGKKLNFMGSEFAQFIEWDYNKQLDWFLLAYPRHSEMQQFVKTLNHFYRTHPAMYAKDCSWEGFEWLNVNDRERSSIAFMRMGGGERIVCAFNFTPNRWELQVSLPAQGSLELLLSSDEKRFGGSGSALERVESTGLPFGEGFNSAFIELPPLSAVYYLFREEEK